MRADEVRDAGSLLGRTADGVAQVVQDVHRATSRRVFDALGPVAAPVRVVHDGMSLIAHGSTRLGLRAVPVAAGHVAALTRIGAGAPAYDSPTGRAVLSAVAGILGDTVAADQPSLAPPLALRTHGGALRTSAPELLGDLGHATGRIVLFVHGLCESDMSWRAGAERHWGDPDVTFGSKLRDGAGWTPLYLTYNSGRHVSDNGADLAALLDAVVAAWPVDVQEVALVGHSMGGLVMRSAVAVAQSNDLPWIGRLRHLVFLGTPHLGAPLEQGVHRAAVSLARWPETEPFAAFLRRRSVGVKDLRHGALTAADWADLDLDADRPDRCTVVPFPPGVGVHAVGVTLARRHDSVLGRTVGDLLVHFDSAGARRHATRSIPSDGVHHLGGLHHFDLLDHPAVWSALRDWLR